MSNGDYKLVALKEREDLLQKSVDLLNQEWPRSQAAREHSQRRSLRATPPMAFLYLEAATDRLVGHARVCLLPNRPEGIWVESVIVSREERGKGLGKALMLLVEEFCKRLGFKQAYLSTEDKVEFYRRCGYEECSPILHSTAATSVFPVFDKIDPETTPKPKTLTKNPTLNGTTAPRAPPPPPPPLVKAIASCSNGISTIDHQYMLKNLE